MSAPSVLNASATILPGRDTAFAEWQVRHNRVIAGFPGFISSDMLPASVGSVREWTIALHFQTPDQLTIWLTSPQRHALADECKSFLESGTLADIDYSCGTAQEPLNVSEVIVSRIKPGMDERYREWAVRIQHAQAAYPGYRGMYLQPPTAENDGQWTTLIRYDTAAHLEAWKASPERAALLDESKAFIEHEQLTRLTASFPGWVPVDPLTGKGPPDWKTALLVLLGLFPTVMLELRFLSPILGGLAVNSSLATFIGNAISVAITSFVTMPLCVRWFGWWLFPHPDAEKSITTRGLLLLFVCFSIEVAALWHLL